MMIKFVCSALKLGFLVASTSLLQTYTIAMERDLQEVLDFDKKQSAPASPQEQTLTPVKAGQNNDKNKNNNDNETNNQELANANDTKGDYFSCLDASLLGLIIEFARSGETTEIVTPPTSTTHTSNVTTQCNSSYYTNPSEVGRNIIKVVNEMRENPVRRDLGFYFDVDMRNIGFEDTYPFRVLFLCSLSNYNTFLIMTSVSKQFRTAAQHQFMEAKMDLLCGVLPGATLQHELDLRVNVLMNFKHFLQDLSADSLNELSKKNIEFLDDVVRINGFLHLFKFDPEIVNIIKRRVADLGSLRARGELLDHALCNNYHREAVELLANNNFEILYSKLTNWRMLRSFTIENCELFDMLPAQHGAHFACLVIRNILDHVDLYPDEIERICQYFEETLPQLPIDKGLLVAQDIFSIKLKRRKLDDSVVPEGLDEAIDMAQAYLNNNSLPNQKH